MSLRNETIQPLLNSKNSIDTSNQGELKVHIPEYTYDVDVVVMTTLEGMLLEELKFLGRDKNSSQSCINFLKQNPRNINLDTDLPKIQVKGSKQDIESSFVFEAVRRGATKKLIQRLIEYGDADDERQGERVEKANDVCLQLTEGKASLADLAVAQGQHDVAKYLSVSFEVDRKHAKVSLVKSEAPSFANIEQAYDYIERLTPQDRLALFIKFLEHVEFWEKDSPSGKLPVFIIKTQEAMNKLPNYKGDGQDNPDVGFMMKTIVEEIESQKQTGCCMLFCFGNKTNEKYGPFAQVLWDISKNSKDLLDKDKVDAGMFSSLFFQKVRECSAISEYIKVLSTLRGQLENEKKNKHRLSK